MLTKLLFVSISLIIISGAFLVHFLDKTDWRFQAAFISTEAFNGANFVLLQTMLQKKMQPDSRGTIIGLQGITIAAGMGISIATIGRVYDDVGHRHAFAIPFVAFFLYWVALTILIIYRK
tara:strand:+ start:1072 stop:1431 length:360 start_codon:yes stop_codon:yes gene_type:complete